jgi:chitinase
MKLFSVSLLAGAATLVLAGCGPRASVQRPTAQVANQSEMRLVGYYFGPTARRGFLVSQIPGNYLTHINYAFGNIGSDGRARLGNPCLDIGECKAGEANPNTQPGGNFAEFRRLKERLPHLQLLISIGGWGWSALFSDVAATPESRARFVDSVLEVFFRNQPGVFDGVDLDWEYPVSGGLPDNHYRPEDRRNYTVLLQDFRRALDQLGGQSNRRYLLTIATPAGPIAMRNFELDSLASILDFMNVMTYDFHTGGRVTHFNAPLGSAENDPTPSLNVRSTVDFYLAAGVPRQKLVVGVPFYGYGYGGVINANNGLFQTMDRNSGSAPSAIPPWVGSVRFHQIPQALREGFTRYWEPGAGVPWLYNPNLRTWITYDDAESLGLKADLVRERALGGVMIWELSGDDGTLLPNLHRRLHR